MRPANSRAGLLPLAVTLIVVAACADDRLTTAPRITPTSSPRQALDGNVILVTNASGANVPGSLPWAVSVSGGGSVIQFDSSLAGSTIAVDATLEPFADITVGGPATEGITITANVISAENTTAQWNADQLQGRPVGSTSPTLNYVLKWDGDSWGAKKILTAPGKGEGQVGLTACPDGQASIRWASTTRPTP